MEHAVPAYIVQDEQLEIIGASEGFSSLIGCAPSDIVGHSLGDFIVEEDRYLFQRAQARYLQDRRNHRAVWRLARRDDRSVSVVITSAEVETDAGVRVVASFEEALGGEVVALPRSDGEVYGSLHLARSFLAHQIASPLNSMRGLFSTIRPGEEDAVCELLPMIVARLDRMVEDCHALGREFVYLADATSGHVSLARDVVITRVMALLQEAGVSRENITVDVTGSRDVSVALETLDAIVWNVLALSPTKGIGGIRMIFGEQTLHLFISAPDAPKVNLLDQAQLNACTSSASTLPIRDRFLMCQLRAAVWGLGLRLTFDPPSVCDGGAIGASKCSGNVAGLSLP